MGLLSLFVPWYFRRGDLYDVHLRRSIYEDGLLKMTVFENILFFEAVVLKHPSSLINFSWWEKRTTSLNKKVPLSHYH